MISQIIKGILNELIGALTPAPLPQERDVFSKRG
jgi:hypothetical protein